MIKVKSLDDLTRLKKEIIQKKELSLENHKNTVQVKVAMATCAIASGAKEILNFFNTELEKRNIDAEITQTGCMCYCYAEPTVEVKLPGKEPVVFGYVDQHKADQIIEKYIKNGEILEGVIPVNYNSVEY